MKNSLTWEMFAYNFSCFSCSSHGGVDNLIKFYSQTCQPVSSQFSLLSTLKMIFTI